MLSRLILDPAASGAWNMAVDEALLDSAAEEGVATLRFYRWDEPTLSLGYFQKYADRESHEPSRGAAVVRRSSGGGALVHHHELTYCLALPADAPSLAAEEPLTCAAHKRMIKALTRCGAEAPFRLADCASGSMRQADEPFLCFLRRSVGDLLAEAPGEPAGPSPDGGGVKICGSAQRKRRGAVLQHGGVMLAASPRAPELLGLSEIGFGCDIDSLQVAMAEQLATLMPAPPEPASLTSHEASRAARIGAERFAADEWTHRR